MIKEFSYKKFGKLEFSKATVEHDSLNIINDHIKVLFIPQNAIIQVDFQEIEMHTDALLFINPHVILKPCETIDGQLMHFNRDFYCVEIHDLEVACDGILYNNVFEIPFINLNEQQSEEIQNIINAIDFELKNEDAGTEEMLRTLLKLIILKSTRIWKQQHQLADDMRQTDVQFLRKFSKLVE